MNEQTLKVKTSETVAGRIPILDGPRRDIAIRTDSTGTWTVEMRKDGDGPWQKP